MPGVYVFWWVGKFLSSDQQVKLATSIRQNRWRGEGRLIRAYHLSGDANVWPYLDVDMQTIRHAFELAL